MWHNRGKKPSAAEVGMGYYSCFLFEDILVFQEHVFPNVLHTMPRTSLFYIYNSTAAKDDVSSVKQTNTLKINGCLVPCVVLKCWQ